jgi:hypothetical protein
MKKLTSWLVHRFLPVVARESLVAENDRLTQELRRSREENAQLRSYISGLEAGIRSQRRIVINTGEGSK